MRGVVAAHDKALVLRLGPTRLAKGTDGDQVFGGEGITPLRERDWRADAEGADVAGSDLEGTGLKRRIWREQAWKDVD
jgi:hypothetical protein